MTMEALVRRERGLKWAGILVFAAMLVVVLATPAPAAPASTQGANGNLKIKAAAELELTEAQIEKTRAETRKLELDDSRIWRALSSLAPLLTALIAAFGLFASVKKAGTDRRETEKAAEITRFDERFAKAVEGLSSTNGGEQGGAAVLVASMVRDKQAALSDQALRLLLVALQSPHEECGKPTFTTPS